MLRFLSATLLVLAGCDLNLDFNTTATSITATAYDDTQTTVSICAGPSGLLDCNEDNLTFEVTVDGVAQQAMETGFISFGTLEASFSTSADDASIEVAELPAGAVASGSLPAPFELFGPVPSGDGSEFHLAWTASSEGDKLSWSAGTSCSTTSSDSGSSDPNNPTSAATIDDTGVLTLHTSDLPAINGTDCTATITLTRERDGDASSFGDGSTMTIQQVRTVTFGLSYM